MKADIPANEIERLKALFSYRILDTEQDPIYDAIANLAGQIMGTQYAMIVFLDEKRTWWKASKGYGDSSTGEGSREHSFCSHTILKIDAPTIVKDATKDHRFSDNPYVLGEPKIRFYAGAPLVSGDAAIGTVCTFDSIHIEATNSQIESLINLSKIIMAHLELREFVISVHEEIDKLVAVKNVSAVGEVYNALNDRCDAILDKIKARKKKNNEN